MAYIAPIHRPNSVRHAVRAQLFPDQDECLVMAKANRLEFWKVDDESSTLIHFDTKAIFGTISMLQKISPKDADLDLLFVGTDRFHYFTLGWDPELKALETIQSFNDVNEKHMRDSQSQDKCITDPTGRYMVVLLWEGVLNVLRLGSRKNARLDIQWQDQCRINELFIKSATFLHVETGKPKVAFLYQTRTDVPDAQLVTYNLYSDEKNTQPSRFEPRDQVDRFEIKDPGAAMIIPVGRGEEDHKRYIIRNAAQARAQLGGFIVVGETRLLYYDDAAKKTVETALTEASIFVAWAEYDVSHYFVADDYGNLWLLEILLDGSAVVDGLEMKKIGSTSRANTLVYMGGDLLFVGAHYGDSQVFNVNAEEGWTLQQVQQVPNISPVLDFTIMDMGNREGEDQTTNEYSSGQARIVTGSGVFKDGSLRSVRSGVGLEDVGILAEMEGIQALFPIRSKSPSKVNTLLVSFLLETRVFSFDSSGEIEEFEAFKGLSLNEQTLLVLNLSNERLLQVTSTAVQLIDLEGGMVISSWKPSNSGSITNASANDNWVLLSVDGKTLISLQLAPGLKQVQHNEPADSDQIACIHLPPQYPSLGVVGFWKSGKVSIVDLNTLQPLHSESLRRKDDNTSIPRDLALAQVIPPSLGGPTLFVSMEDGLIITFNVSPADFSLSGRKSIVLGTRYARLQLLPIADDTYNVFSTSEHPSLIYATEGRIIYSAVTAEDAVCVCPFDSEAFPDSIVVATENELKISVLDRERRTHVQSLPMGQTVRRIAYSRNEHAFALGCIQREVVDNEEIITSSIRLVDEVIFDKVGQDFVLNSFSGLEMVEAVIRVGLPDSYGARAERFLVGTSFPNEAPSSAGTKDAIKGRILVFGIDSERNLYQIASHNLKGACRCLGVIGEHIVAGLAKTVVVYRYNELTSSTAKLDRLASYRPSSYPVDLAVEGNTIAVADLMKSITLVEFTPPQGDEPAKLQEVARHHHAAWATAVSHIEGSSWLEADANGNLMILSPNEQGATEEDRKRMDITSEMNLGEMVNRIRKVNVDSSENAIVVPRAFLGTVEGGIYFFGIVSARYQDLLFRFQNNIVRAVSSLGDIKFDTYRSFRNEQREGGGPFRFIDGELIERFTDLDEKIQEEICNGLGPDVETMRNLVEEMKRLH
ncbi:putative Mono-functional DNA-alkylating methyl methanesulfonate N-term-domain-containing protein [Seiridium cardinale]|uniref:Mono-functional DNA-alkylating methyl methanesulfonate N-term-domain-containing protein n=1 Tax=Seiridium cardinale TaxID=138064 RepID=A0ABR2XBQ2_9PEZI